MMDYCKTHCMKGGVLCIYIIYISREISESGSEFKGHAVTVSFDYFSERQFGIQGACPRLQSICTQVGPQILTQ